MWHLDLINDDPRLLVGETMEDLLGFARSFVAYLHHRPPPHRGAYSRSCGTRRPGISLIFNNWVSVDKFCVFRCLIGLFSGVISRAVC